MSGFSTMTPYADEPEPECDEYFIDDLKRILQYQYDDEGIYHSAITPFISQYRTIITSKFRRLSDMDIDKFIKDCIYKAYDELKELKELKVELPLITSRVANLLEPGYFEPRSATAKSVGRKSSRQPVGRKSRGRKSGRKSVGKSVGGRLRKRIYQKRTHRKRAHKKTYRK